MFNSNSDGAVVQTKLLATCWLGQKGQVGKRGRAAHAPSNIFCLFRNFQSDLSHDYTLNITNVSERGKTLPGRSVVGQAATTSGRLQLCTV